MKRLKGSIEAIGPLPLRFVNLESKSNKESSLYILYLIYCGIMHGIADINFVTQFISFTSDN